MNAQAREAALFQRFAELGIMVETHNHPPLHTVEESRALRGSIPGGHCKNLFLKDRKQKLWLIVTLEEREIDLKNLHKQLKCARLSFGNAELLFETLKVRPGAVTPFGLIHDIGQKVQVVLDRIMLEESILNYHPLRNDSTCSISREDLLKFIVSCGHKPLILDLNAGFW